MLAVANHFALLAQDSQVERYPVVRKAGPFGDLGVGGLARSGKIQDRVMDRLAVVFVLPRHRDGREEPFAEDNPHGNMVERLQVL